MELEKRSEDSLVASPGIYPRHPEDFVEPGDLAKVRPRSEEKPIRAVLLQPIRTASSG